MKNRLWSFLFNPVDASTLCLFRILFGAVLTYQIIYYFQLDYTYQFMSGPEMRFNYPMMSWLTPLPEAALKGLQWGLLLAAIAITLGVYHRFAAAYFTIVFSYFTFIDKTLYNNHLYLFALLCFLMFFLQADQRYNVFGRKENKMVPQWQLRILQFMIIVVYFYGGVAKLNADWLNGSLPGILLEVGLKKPPSEILVGLISYGGLLFDLSIGFLLLKKATRLPAIILVLIFNLTNGFLLFDDIGVFPIFMIGSTILFLDPDKTAHFVGAIFDEKEKKRAKKKQNKTSTKVSVQWDLKHMLITGLLLLFVGFHLIFPLRHYWLTYNPEWTGIARNFSWRMKLQHKKVTDFNMSIQEGREGTPKNVDFASFLSQNQLTHLLDDPRNIVQLAQYLDLEALKRNMKDPVVKARVVVRFNGRPAQLMIDPNVDLSNVSLKRAERHIWLKDLE